MPSKPLVLPASVTVDGFEDGGQAFYSVKIGTAAFEINIHLLAKDASKFGSVLAVQWGSGALRIGECAGAPVFWCSVEDGSSISVLVGHDDQTWDFGVQLPASTIGEILDGIERASNA